MKLPTILRLPVSRTIALLSLLGLPAYGNTYNWTQTSGTNYDWNQSINWDPNTGFPQASTEIANVTTDLTASQTIRLRQAISVGTLNLGDTDASGSSFGFTIGNASGETFALTFDSGDFEVPAQLNLQSSGTPTNTLAVPVKLLTDLNVNLGTGSQTLSISSAGSINTGAGLEARVMTITGGTAGVNQFNVTGDLAGEGLIRNSSNAALVMFGAKSFTGVFDLNKGIGGSNTGSLTLTNGSVANAAEIIINGYLTNGITQNGGSVHSGNASAMGANPGQRLTENRITFNGGTLSPVGQTATTTGTSPWTSGQEYVRDEVATIALNSSYSHISMARSTTTAGTILNVGTLERNAGASLYVRSSTLGLEVSGSNLYIGNADDFLIGAGGAVGSTNMSIIPWIGANNTAAGTGNPTGFATHTSTGLRALDSVTEYAQNTMTGGAGSNVNLKSTNPVAPELTAPTTINSLRNETTNYTWNVGDGQVLTIASGGLFFAAGGSRIGATGNVSAGTIDFGNAEGVVWSLGLNINTIGASISGTAGLSKAGTGTLVLTGINNTYDGLTYVSGGTLQVGTATDFSTLGFSNDVAVAAGAQLTLAGGDMIMDTAVLRLEQFGLANGKVSLFPNVNETIGALFLGDELMDAGTYGAVGSGAVYQSDTWFSGDGILTVVPEPGSAALLLGGIGMLLGRRRRS